MSTKVEIGYADVGHEWSPGGSCSLESCTIYSIASKNGTRYEAKGEDKTGRNQGYCQWDYAHGPWIGRGQTAREACERMVARAKLDKEEYGVAMLRASLDAIIDMENKAEEEEEESAN